MAGRRTRTKTDENRAITPDMVGRGSPRSRKCLDMDQRVSAKQSPLTARNQQNKNWSEREEFTPHKEEKGKDDAGSENLRPPQEPEFPEPSSPDIIPRTPSQYSSIAYTQVATPRSGFHRTPQRSLLIATPRRKSGSRASAAIPDKFKQPPPSSRKQEEKPRTPVNLPKIEVSSFYGSAKIRDGETTETAKSSVPVQSRSEPRKLASRGLRRESSHKPGRRSLGGVKRKSEGVNRAGFGHAIKRPKKKPKIDIKISDLPAMSIEIPGSKNAQPPPKTPSTKAAKTPVTPKTGNFSMSKETGVDYEVKGGQIIYRKSNTPARRSPRKHMSPLKQSYFQGAKPKARTNGKLFSPGADFLSPDLSSPQKNIPSPVKFSVSVEDDDEETDIGDLIHRLDEDVDMEPGVQLDLVAGSIVSSQFLDADPAVTAFKAVQDILGELGTDLESDSSASQSMEEERRDESGKLYPIFYKDTAQTGANTPDHTSKTQHRRGFVCQDPNQLQIDAGQERGPTLCLTCASVYTKGDPVDEASHEQFHNGVVERLKFPGWRNERNCGDFGTGRILMIQPGDPKHMWRKVEDALTVVDRDLGFSEVGIRFPDRTKVFLYTCDKKIVGFLLAEAIDNGYRVITQTNDSEKVYLCSETPNPVQCGISRIWVLSDYRRRGIASKLVGTMRKFFLLGHHLGEDEFAFSDPTLNGMDFATSYMKKKDFLVYNR